MTLECGEPIMKLRTDNGGEYMSKEFQTYLTSKGIEHQLTVPHSPQQNGVAERLNSTLMESARAMLSHSNLPNKFWAEALATAAYLRNRITTSANEQQLTFEKWYGTNPISVTSKCLGVQSTLIFLMQKGESLTRKHGECVSLAAVRIQKDIS